MNDVLRPELSAGHLDDNTLIDIKRNLNKYDLFSLLRRLESSEMFNGRLLGETVTPKQDFIRLFQNPSLTFSYRSIESIDVKDNYVQLAANGVGLLGVNSPLPLHLIEYIFQRKHQYGDTAWASFVNMLQHRVLTLFYRSWMNAQSVIALEVDHTDKFSRYIASLVGLAETDHQKPSHIDYYSKLYYVGLYLQRNQSSDNFETLLSQYFQVPIKVVENIGTWFDLPKSEQTCLGQTVVYNLGDGLILGSRIYDVQTKFRLIIGPLDLLAFESFVKNELNSKRLAEWVQLYVGVELDWDVQLILAQKEVPKLTLTGGNRLGLTTWLGEVNDDVHDVIVNYQM